MGKDPPQTILRQCRQQDIAILEHHIPAGRNRYHEARYRRQREGFSTFLIAYIGDIPVGSGEVLWQGAKESDVRDRFPDCPEINGLAVVPERQSQGIGTTIIRAAEQLAARRGHHRIGIGVDDHNLRAVALYLRLGYEDTGCRYFRPLSLHRRPRIPSRGRGPCRFLIKAISGVPD
jgi:GNAT superfamily N-acetyltransferase